MRDPQRIDVMLKKIETIWKAAPDLRLMQLLLNAIGSFSGLDERYQPLIKDHYYTEDDVVLDKLNKLYKRSVTNE